LYLFKISSKVIKGTAIPFLNLRKEMSRNVLPPGYYMLFIITQDETPSIGHFIQVL